MVSEASETRCVEIRKGSSRGGFFAGIMEFPKGFAASPHGVPNGAVPGNNLSGS